MATKQKKIILHIYTWLLTVFASLYKYVFEAKSKTRRGKIPLRIVLLISRPQDVDLLISLHNKAKNRQDMRVCLWMLKKIDIRFPDVLPELKEKNLVVDQMVSFAGLLRLLSKLMRTHIFLSTVESTADRFKLPYILTKIANAAGISTYILQHGFENIGLSYRDKFHGPDIKFASKTILTWGPREELPAWVGKDTLDKCIAVGCPNQPVLLKNNPTTKSGKRPIIAVFDNLHWLRYDEKYRSIFLKHLKDISEQRKEFRFILKSHPVSVRKRSKEMTVTLHRLRSVEVVDLLGEEGKLTTSWLLSQALGVITTPSTIALDGALANAPVAVSRYGLDLTYYSPLCLLDDFKDWQRYLDRLTQKSESSKLKWKSERFLSRVLITGDPVSKILSVMTQEE